MTEQIGNRIIAHNYGEVSGLLRAAQEAGLVITEEFFLSIAAVVYGVTDSESEVKTEINVRV